MTFWKQIVPPSANIESADGTLAQLQNRSDNEFARPIYPEVHQDDFVATIIGRNPPTGGSSSLAPDGSPRSRLWEWFNIFGGQYTAHNCYGRAAVGCAGYWPTAAVDSGPTPSPSNGAKP